ncbi:DEAD/DEAH box helicase [Rhodoferax bucti]|uniref:DEAD/DEAH box helicase n=1 Tax=Rhodoferax bucti TaxID=2576305 RepID=UPI00110836CE|nr:DEAD/DEAH box helicase [Rhodoferax bucti]
MTFSSLGLHETLVAAMAQQGYAQPTPVQSAAVPPAVAGRDVLVCAQTGSGKTAAFALAVLQRCKPASSAGFRHPQALVLVPTRELAVQVGGVLSGLARVAGLPVRVSVVFGGVSINPQLMALRGGTDVVVATTGRLLDIVAHNALDLGRVETLVLDEADRMLDLGFAEELERVLAMVPAQRQSLLFSATYSAAVRRLAEARLRDPVEVTIDTGMQAAPDIMQRAVTVDPSRRTQLLRHLVQQEQWPRVLVFVATKYAAEMVADKLRRAGLQAEPFHAQLSQGKRGQVLADFKASDVQVVVATDVAARGVDIAGLPVVVNFDLPRAAADYIHRIGRTGRAGLRGMAVSFVTAENAAHFALIEKRHALEVVRETVAGFEPEVALPTVSRDQAAGGVKGRRPSKKDKLRAAGLLPPLA